MAPVLFLFVFTLAALFLNLKRGFSSSSYGFIFSCVNPFRLFSIFSFNTRHLQSKQSLNVKAFVPDLTFLTVQGKTRRISKKNSFIQLKLGFTNKTLHTSFNLLLFFFKRKIFVALGSFSPLASLVSVKAYTKNGLFADKNIKTLRIGKLSTFR